MDLGWERGRERFGWDGGRGWCMCGVGVAIGNRWIARTMLLGAGLGSWGRTHRF